VTTPTLPKSLVDQGFILIVRAPDRMFAVSTNRGCTKTCATIGEVIAAARKIASWCAWMDENYPIQNPKG
jgi:hypothetical protein